MADSLISTINTRAGSGDFTRLDLESETLLEVADQLWHSSGGLFDITSGVLRKAWRFDATHIPVDVSQLASLQDKVGWEKVERTAQGIHLPVKGMEIDLGGLVKEYAADSAVSLLRDHGVTSGLIELAGDVATIGCQPSGCHGEWVFGHPREVILWAALPYRMQPRQPAAITPAHSASKDELMAIYSTLTRDGQSRAQPV